MISRPATRRRSASGDGGPWAAIGAAALLLLGIVALGGATVAWRRRRRLLAGDQAEAQIAELRAALESLGWKLGPRTTLLAIERRSTGAARSGIRRYAASLREHRYGAAPGSPPGPRERRALRRSLGSGGVVGRLRALTAIPPGGPGRT